ncbi:histidine phosphatase family protein [uncultured Sphingomonas sp.]|uniref:histidine phosphatase family protein n=1 Tax=uncultured Sphingomonas sp. TaxID=158754 RepID=UPI0025D38952|nr:histidine phosphatase family protein [uncultured Sphingomonas sp.]
MSTRLVLLCAGATASARGGGFPDPAEPLDAGGRDKARTCDPGVSRASRCWTSPSHVARETAAMLGLAPVEEPALRDIGCGDWTGLPFGQIDRQALAGWLAAPEAGTPGGESMAEVLARVAPWMDGLGEGPALAITHAAVIRAAIGHALGASPAATLGIDVAPLSVTVLSRHGRWRLRELRRA